jgi:glycosyltransferase involved in cell wall biosynthesis
MASMKVLMFSLDPHILELERGAGKRMTAYATLVDKLIIVLFSTGGSTIEKENLTIYPTSRYKIISFLKGLWLGYRTIKTDRPDLITLHDFAPFLIGYPLSLWFKIPLQAQVHSTFLSPFWKESTKNTIYQALAKFFVPRATCVRVVSERIKKQLVNDLHIPESKISVLPVFTDAKQIAATAPQFDLRACYPQFKSIALIASRLVQQKNVELAIDAMKQLLPIYPHLGLVIVGAGPHEEQLKVLAEPMRERVVFEGWSSDVVSYYKGADLFLLTSNYEGWAMSVVEAMASETAVIMTDVGCAGDVVIDGKNGIVIPVNDLNALVRAMSKLLSEPQERARLAKAGKQTVLMMEPRTWDEYLDLYKRDWERCVSAYRNRKS